MSELSRIAARVGNSSLFGFGSAAGRDGWDWLKRSSAGILIFIAIASAFALPLFGARRLTNGAAPNARFHRIIGIGLIFVGLIIGVLFFHFETAPEAHRNFHTKWFLIATAVGLGWGAFERPRRRKLFDTIAHNEAFLDAIGLRETGESEITHIDGNGANLRLLETKNDGMVFLGVGLRNKRAYIAISPDGKITGYTGLLRLDEPRVYMSPFAS